MEREVQENKDLSLKLRGLRPIESIQSDLHHIELYQHELLGKVLVIDREIQHVEHWAPLYHDPLVHLAASFVPCIRNVLILGGGSLFAAHEVLKYNSVVRVMMVDHDQAVLELVCRHYPHAARARDDPRLHIRYDNIEGGLIGLEEKFDLVLNDAVDLLEPHFGAFNPSRFMSSEGVFSDVIYRHALCKEYTKRTIARLAKHANYVMSLIFVPEYPGILHFLTISGCSKRISQEARSSQNQEQLAWCTEPSANPCSYFDPRFLAYYLYLSPLTRAVIQRAIDTASESSEPRVDI